MTKYVLDIYNGSDLAEFMCRGCIIELNIRTLEWYQYNYGDDGFNNDDTDGSTMRGHDSYLNRAV